MKKILLQLIVILIFYNGSAQSQQQLSFTILQLNDVYEIAPLDGGIQGGMARVATIRKELLKKDANTITVLAGDFVSPSLIGTLSYFDSSEQKKLKVAGKHMIEVMNETGVDYVTFGNHEFDINLDLLQRRINESKFTWLNSNVSLADNAPFKKIANSKSETIMPYDIRTLQFPGGQSLRMGIIGVTIPFNKTQPVFYADVNKSVLAAYNQLKGKCEIIVALTHLSIEEDMELAKAVPGLHLILGGHEHVNSKDMAGNVPIYKADANAKSAYIHTLTYNTSAKQVSVASRLKMIDESVAFDVQTNAVVNKWINFADKAMKDMGYNPYDSLMYAAVPLDGRESEVRNRVTNYTQLIVNSLFFADSTIDVAMFNSGSLRVDDQLKGTITQYDVLRSLPFGGGLVMMNVSGSILQTILNTGTITNKNNGGFLQFANANWISSADYSTRNWYVGNKLLDTNIMYKILLPEFVAKGNESNLEFLSKVTYCTPVAFKNFALKNDIRDVVIYYMKHLLK